MSGLFGTLDVALQSLLTQQSAVRVTTDNLGNVSTDGYSRRRAVITEQIPVYQGSLIEGRGAIVASVESIRDRVLELRLSAEQQQQSATDAFITSLSTVETLFANSDSDLGSQVQNFFNSLNQLSTSPTDPSYREGVLTAAGNLAESIQNISRKMTDQSRQIDLSIEQTVADVNRLTVAIASINQEVASRDKLGQDAGTLEDQRSNLIAQLASKIDIYISTSADGLTLTTANGEPLVVAGNAYPIDSATQGTTGEQHILAGESDITSALRGGELGGLIQARQQISSLSAQLDSFAFAFASTVNTAHQNGFDLNGNAGSKLFDIGAIASGCASVISLAISDPSALAASSDSSSGGNDNLLNMISLQNQPIIAGETPAAAYSSLVFQLGGSIANARADLQAGEIVLNQLKNLRGAISGVSLDEESANLIRFQQAYQASARVIQTINDMLDVAVNLGRN